MDTGKSPGFEREFDFYSEGRGEINSFLEDVENRTIGLDRRGRKDVET